MEEGEPEPDLEAGQGEPEAGQGEPDPEPLSPPDLEASTRAIRVRVRWNRLARNLPPLVADEAWRQGHGRLQPGWQRGCVGQ
jgi:hypothetical protein